MNTTIRTTVTFETTSTTTTTGTTTDRIGNDASIPATTTAAIGMEKQHEEDAIMSSVCPCQVLVVTEPIDRVIEGGCIDH